MADIGKVYDGINDKYKFQENKAAPANQSDMDKDAFLNLLVTQMKYQDPLNPTNDKEFLAQMAQFTSLEQMQNLNKTTSLSQGYELIGKVVKGSYVDETTKENKFVDGEVTGAKMKSGNVYVVVDGSQEIELSKIQSVDNKIEKQNEQNEMIIRATKMISKNVKWNENTPDNKIQELQGIVEEVKIKEDGVYLIVNNADSENRSEVKMNQVKNIDDRINAYVKEANATNISQINQKMNEIISENTNETE